MGRAGNKIANEFIKKVQELCSLHDGAPYTLPSGRIVCNKCGKDWKSEGAGI